MTWVHPSVECDRKRSVFLACPRLEQRLGPALRPGHVVEVVGEAGSAKTQFCLHLALKAASVGSKAVLYVATKGTFPVKRLGDMVKANKLSASVMDKIVVDSVWDAPSLFTALETKPGKIEARFGLSLLIIDSIAGPFRADYEDDQRRERSQIIHRLGYLLHCIARKHDIPVVTVNQVTALIDQKQATFGRTVTPCFGLAWSTYVHSRLFMSRTELVFKNTESQEANTRLRTVTIDFSPLLPPLTTHFVVDDLGVRGVQIAD